MTKTTPKKVKSLTCSQWQKKCDALLSPIIIKLFPRCEACGNPTQVAHHWIEKSRSSYLRYVLDNLIPLCHSCHAKIHNRFGNSITGCLGVAEIIIKRRGKKWKEEMDRDGRKINKVNTSYYEQVWEKLSTVLDK
jgi:hypothetical protein